MYNLKLVPKNHLKTFLHLLEKNPSDRITKGKNIILFNTLFIVH